MKTIQLKIKKMEKETPTRSPDFRNTSKNIMIARVIFAASVIIGAAVFLDIIFKSGFSFWLVFFIGVWLIILWRFWFNIVKGSLKLTFVLGYFFVAVVISVIALALATPPETKNQPANNSSLGGSESGSSDTGLSNGCDEWVDYTGPNASHFTFKYPKCYTIDESERSTWVNNNKQPKYDDHFLVTWIDGKHDPVGNCQGSAAAGETLLFSKPATLSGIPGCEQSVTKKKSGSNDLFTVNIWSLKEPNRYWTVLYWVREKEDQEIFEKMVKSLVINNF